MRPTPLRIISETALMVRYVYRYKAEAELWLLPVNILTLEVYHQP